MYELLYGEARKLLTVRTPVGMVIGAVLVVSLGTLSTVMSLEPGSLSGPMHDQMFYFLTSISLGVFALTLGMRSFTDEFRHGTVISTFLAQSSRSRVLIAKALISMFFAASMAVLAIVSMVGLATMLAGVKEGQVAVVESDLSAFLGLIGGAAVWAAIGTGLGALIRNQVAAIVGGLVWVVVVENVASGFLGEATRFLPGQAAHALADVTRASNLAEIPVAALLLAGYVLVIALLAVLTLDRRDLI